MNVQVPINFEPATDVVFFDPALTGFSTISFANDFSSNLPTTGLNAVVVRDQPAAAGTAHTAIANQITDSGPGFFIYFNTTLNLPRLVFARDQVIRMQISLSSRVWRTSAVMSQAIPSYCSKFRPNSRAFDGVADVRRPAPRRAGFAASARAAQV